MNNLEQDKPEVFIENDKFDLIPYIDNLFNTLNSIDADNGFSFCLNGRWGSGKTTIINFLKEKNILEKQKSHITIVDFSPWNITNKQSLLKDFFNLLKNTFYKQSGAEKIISFFNDYYDFFIEAMSIVKPENKYIPFFLHLAHHQTKNEDKNLLNIKNEIINFLKTENLETIVIVIDDLDRLNYKELVAILQLIKEIANFPKIIYLLPVDMEILIRSVNKYYKYSKNSKFGNDYVNKIIQLRWNIPSYDKSYYRIYIENIIKRLVSYDIINSEKSYFDYSYKKALSQLITDFRTAKTLCNCFKINWELLKEKTNYVDLLLLSYIQMFDPQLMRIIKDGRNRGILFGDNTEEKRQSFLNTLSENQVIFIKCLFFENEKSYPNIRLLIRNANIFETYFSYRFVDGVENPRLILQYVQTNNETKLLEYLKRNPTSMISKKLNIILECCNYLERKVEYLRTSCMAALEFFNSNNKDIFLFVKYFSFLFQGVSEENVTTCINQIILDNKYLNMNNSLIRVLFYFSFSNLFNIKIDIDYANVLDNYFSQFLKNNCSISNDCKQSLCYLLLKYGKYSEVNYMLSTDISYSIDIIRWFFSSTFSLMMSEDPKGLWDKCVDNYLENMKNCDKYIEGFLHSSIYQKYDFNNQDPFINYCDINKLDYIPQKNIFSKMNKK